jgi:lipoprotein signal peptidase
VSVVNRKKLRLRVSRVVHSIEFDFLIMVVLVGADQWTKRWFQQRDQIVMNPGGFLGIFPDFWWLGLLLLVWLLLLRHWTGYPRGWSRFGLLLILSGGLGNLLDRILFGSVRDFIYYPILNFYGNLADILLVLGVLISLTASLLLQYKPCAPPKDFQ